MSKRKETPSFEKFCLDKAESIAKQVKAGEDQRTQIAVAMTRRFRANSASDKFGFFSPNGTQAWLGDHRDDTEAMADMHFLPLLRRAVVANMSAMITGAVRVTAEAATKEPTAGGVASVAASVFAVRAGNKDFWSRRLEAQAAQAAQLGYGVALRTRFNPHKKGEKVKEIEWGEEMMPMPGEYVCGVCATGGPFEGPVSEEGTTTCPECGAEAEVVEAPTEEPMEVPVGERFKNSGEMELSLHPHYEIRADERRTGGGNLDAARWFEHHYLASGDEIEQENPGFDPGPAEEWSFPLKWLHALRSGTVEHFQKFDADCDIHEVREICLLPEDYATHVEPHDGGYVLKGADGQPILDEDGRPAFQIRPGERLIDIFPEGFRFKLCNRQLLPGTPDDPGVKAYDFREEWSYFGFAPDPYTFYHGPLLELLGVGDDLNTMYTIDFMHRESASKTNLVYDQMMFDPEAFDYDEVPTKDGYSLENGDDIRHHFAVVESPRMQTALEGLTLIMELAPQVGGTPPVALGAPDPTDETYGGQRLKHQRSLMILAPYGQSKAEAKVRVFTQLLKLAQKHWPDERFAYLRSRLGEEWKEQDVDAFREADLDRVLKIDFAEGSEVPTTLMEREQKMGALLAEIVAAIPSIKDAGKLGQELMTMFRRYAELAGVEVDFADTEGDERLAQSRYDYIVEELGRAATEDDVFVFMSHPRLQPFPRESHETHIEFWTDKARALLARAEESDIIMAGLCDQMVRRHDAAGVEGNQTALTNQIESEAPAQALVAEEQAAAQAAESDKMAADAAAREGEQAAAREEKGRDRAHQVGVKAMELASKERQAQQPRANA